MTDTVVAGSLLLAIPIAALAGLVSFLSPCVLPLVPAYLSYATGLAGVDLSTARRGRMVLGSTLFVLGFTAVFVSFGAFFGYIGNDLLARQALLQRVLGTLTVALGMVFLGLVPRLARDLRVHRLPAVGLVGAPMLGVIFGLGWTPCIGPTLGAVLALASTSAGAGRGALLTAVYCLGLGLPFLLTGLAYRRALGTFGWVKRHYVLVVRLGGVMLVLLGLLLVTGLWSELSVQMRVWTSNFTPAI